jgi:PKD repeat protein
MFHKITFLIIASISLFHKQGISQNKKGCQTVSIGQNYSKQQFFSVDSGLIHTIQNSEWDVRFNYFDYSAEINESTTTKCWVKTSTDNASINQGTDNQSYNPTLMDTNGMSNEQNDWTEVHNDIYSKSLAGALNRTVQLPAKGGLQEYGHSFYGGFTPTYTPSHAIRGYRVFVLLLKNGKYIQVWTTISTTGAGHKISTSEIDGSGLRSYAFFRADYSKPQYAYLSLIQNNLLPPSFGVDETKFDLTFTSYYNDSTARYDVGVIANKNVSLRQIDGQHYSNINFQGAYNAKDAGIIGDDWKQELVPNQFTIVPNRNYLIQTIYGNEYVLYFCGFGGKANGNFDFRLISRAEIENQVQPVASFSTADTSICVNDSISFANKSLDANNFEWNFDGASPNQSFDRFPKVKYLEVGHLNVTLIARSIDDSGDTLAADTLVMTDYLKVNEAPIGGFSFTQSINQLQVIDTTRALSIYNLIYDFGDGNQSTDENPTHLYSENGNYLLTQYTTNGCGTDSVSHEVFVNELGLNENSEQTITIHPNPTSGFVTISANNQPLEVSIIDFLGAIYPMELKNNTIDMSDFSTGIYIVLIKSQNRVFTTRIIKQ